MADPLCSSQRYRDCRDRDVAFRLKILANVAIVIACVSGVTVPVVGKNFPAFKANSDFLFVLKSFAAGVILATGFVHMLPEAFESLTNDCLPEEPWAKFPFTGLIAMMAAVLTLMVDFWGTTYFERERDRNLRAKYSDDGFSRSVNTARVRDLQEMGETSLSIVQTEERKQAAPSPTIQPHPLKKTSSNRSSHASHRVFAMGLEMMGLVAHSLIIGISVGTSQKPCTIWPLIVTLTFNQFFEGVALGGSLVQAEFPRDATLFICFFFTSTTPCGIATGIALSSTYSDNTPTDLLVGGMLEAVSAGLLVYIALVDLATEFLSRKMQNDLKLQLLSYLALFLGAGSTCLASDWS